MAKQKKINSIDEHVGQRVRARRLMLGMSQEKLAHALHLTFQQVQKYEKGTNRIGASRLAQIAAALGIEVAYFFEGVSAVPSEKQTSNGKALNPAEVNELMSTRQGVELVRSFLKIDSPKIRQAIVTFVHGIANPAPA
jgi:transcriptional regulator with XRE-family HTH domain